MMRTWFTDRINVLAEGDSWFAYPPKWFIGRKPSNLVHHTSRMFRGEANYYCLASNGDEAVDMVSGKQKHQLVKILRQHEEHRVEPIHLLLFSGGGNDLVDENDFERFLRKTPHPTATQCVNMARLRRKTKQIGLALQELADVCQHYSPDTLIVTHTYDYPYPSRQGGHFLGGLIKTKAWMKRFMEKVGIDNRIQADVIRIFMDTVGDELVKVGNQRRNVMVVDTRGTLKGKKAWLNEIHPTSDGFKSIAEVLVKEIRKEVSGL